MNRAHAKARGLQQYSTGRPCRNGHLAPRATRNGECTGCMKASKKRSQRSATWHARQRDYMRRRAKEAVHVRAYQLWRNAKARAAEKGVSFSLTRERVLAALECGACEQTGIRFELTGTGWHRQHPRAPSIDKKNPFGGYSDANVQIVVWQYNTAKWTGTDGELVAFCAAVLRAKGFQVEALK